MGKRAKKISLKQLYQMIYQHGPCTKPELASQSDISLTAISDYTNQLEQVGLIEIMAKGESSGGRKPILYQTNQTYQYILGLDLRATHFYIFLSDLKANLISSRIVPISSDDYQSYLSAICQSVRDLLSETALRADKVLAIGIALSGITDFAHKVVDRSNELDWTDKPLATDLEEVLSIPVFLETDVRIYARNEIEPTDPNNVVCVLYIGRGIGLALVINNRVFHGYTNRAGDNRFFGEQLTQLYRIIRTDKFLVEVNNQPYYSKSIRREQIEHLNTRFHDHIDLDQDNRQELDDFSSHIARLMIFLINVLNPKKVLLTGNVFDYNDFIYQQVRDKILHTDTVFHVPEIKRNLPSSDPLERGIVHFVMEKFFSLDQFKV